MRRALVAVAATLALLCPASGTIAPAQADLVGASMVHVSPDNGYDAPIRIRFAGESTFVNLPEGEHSDHLRPNGQEDVQEVRLRVLPSGDREEISCQDPNGLGYFVWFDGQPGDTKSMGNFANLNCVIGLQNR